MRTPSGQIWMAWKLSPPGVWRTSKTHFSPLFFRPSKRGSSGGAGRLFLYLKKAKTTVFLGLKTTHYYLFQTFEVLGYGYPPLPPPGGSTEGGHFDPEWLAVRYALDLPPHPGGTPPRPPFWGYPDLSDPRRTLISDLTWRCSHRSSFRYNYFLLQFLQISPDRMCSALVMCESHGF